MKKIIFGIIGVIGIGIIAGGVYWFFMYEAPKPERPKRDPNLWTVPEVKYSMQGKTFMVPNEPTVTVPLTLVAPSTKHDYPMGRFTTASGTEAMLYVMDDFVTDVINGKRAVPLVIKSADGTESVYVALLQDLGGDVTHLSSIYLDNQIKVTAVAVDGHTVSIQYYVHDRNQSLTENPTVLTTAVIDVDAGTLVQAGRKPRSEEFIVTKEFKGVYYWKETELDGVKTTPSKPETFSLTFDGNRISLATDCNSGSAEFTPPTGSSTALAFGPIVSTKMFCESSEEGLYFEAIRNVRSFVESDDALTFTLENGGEMVFEKKKQIIQYENDTASSAVTSE